MGAGSREWPGRGSSCAFANNSPSHSIRAGQCGRISGCLVGHPFRSLGSALHWLVRNDRRVRARSGDAARRGDRVRGSVITMSDPTRPPVRIIHDQRGRCARCAVESSRHVRSPIARYTRRSCQGPRDRPKAFTVRRRGHAARECREGDCTGYCGGTRASLHHERE